MYKLSTEFSRKNKNMCLIVREKMKPVNVKKIY